MIRKLPDLVTRACSPELLEIIDNALGPDISAYDIAADNPEVMADYCEEWNNIQFTFVGTADDWNELGLEPKKPMLLLTPEAYEEKKRHGSPTPRRRRPK